jgi:hypothetical protein
MKKFVIATLLMLILAFSFAFAQTCTDCCTGSACNGVSASSQTLNIEECLVKINDRTVKNDVSVLKAFERGQNLDISVEFTSFQDAKDVQVMAFITGYHRGNKMTEDIFDITSTFDVEANVSYEKTLSFVLPDDFKLNSGDELKIRVEISDKYSHSYIREYNLKVEAPTNNVVIQDILLDPADKIEAGRGLFASVRIKNMGDSDEEGIKITTAIPELELRATQYVDQLDSDESTTSEDMFMKIPSCTEAGDYVVKTTVDYADGDEVVTKQTTIKVTADPECQLKTPATGSDDKTVVTVPGKQDVIKGTAGTVYPIILENKGFTDRSYQLTAGGLDSWATYRFDPGALILLKAGESQTVYLYVTPKADATVGEKVFVATVETAGDKKQIALTANVIEGQTQSPTNTVGGLDLGNLKQGLVLGLVVLVVLVVILGLVVGFNKMKGNEEETEKSGQTYY